MNQWHHLFLPSFNFPLYTCWIQSIWVSQLCLKAQEQRTMNSFNSNGWPLDPFLRVWLDPPSQTIDSSTNRFLSLIEIGFLKILHLKTHKLMHMHKKVSSLFRYWASDGYCLPGLVILSTKLYLIPT